MENYTLSDLKSAVGNDGFGGNSAWVLILLFFFAFGGNGWNRNNGDYGQYAAAASQQDILFSSKFSALDNKIDRIGGGIADATFSLNNSIKDGNAMVAGRVVDEGRALQTQMAQAEIDHTNFWHQLSVNLIEKVRKVYKPTAEMQEKWDDVHKKYVEEMAEIDRMLSL